MGTERKINIFGERIIGTYDLRDVLIKIHIALSVVKIHSHICNPMKLTLLLFLLLFVADVGFRQDFRKQRKILID